MPTLVLAVEFPDDDSDVELAPDLVASGLVDTINAARFSNGCPFGQRLNLAGTPVPHWRRAGTCLTVP